MYVLLRFSCSPFSFAWMVIIIICTLVVQLKYTHTYTDYCSLFTKTVLLFERSQVKSQLLIDYFTLDETFEWDG